MFAYAHLQQQGTIHTLKTSHRRKTTRTPVLVRNDDPTSLADDGPESLGSDGIPIADDLSPEERPQYLWNRLIGVASLGQGEVSESEDGMEDDSDADVEVIQPPRPNDLSTQYPLEELPSGYAEVIS